MSTLDVFIFVTCVLGIYKGYSKGLVIAVLSVLSWIFGWMIAVKISKLVVEFLGPSLRESRIGPMIAFIVSFVIISVAIIYLGKLLNKILKLVMLGWANRLAGAAIYLTGALIISSSIVWLSDALHIFESQKSTSILYPFIKPIAPAFANTFDVIFPVLKNTYNDIELMINSKIK